MVMEKIIVISELIRGELRSRTEAKKIYTKVLELNTQRLCIDFANVRFMSRSFADELCNILESLEKTGIEIQVTNKSDSIDLIMKIVKGNRNKPRVIKEDSEVKEFSDMDTLSDFLLTI